MGQPAKQTPAHVYVSLDSAPTARERVDLALAEMERVGAFDRSLIMLVSPTGSGYVNYVAIAAASYLTLGDVATVTLQYSKRPSPLSLGKVKGAREQNRLLWLTILQAAARQARPAAAGGGLRGEPRRAHQPGRVPALGHAWGRRRSASTGRSGSARRTCSGWMHEVTGPDRLDVDKDAVAVVNDFAQLEDARRGAPREAALRAGQPRQRRGHQVRSGPAHHRRRRGSARTARSPRRSPAPARGASRPACAGGRSRRSSRA